MTKRVYFYAPLKSPCHPTPSGDREIARRLMGVLEASGWQVELVSQLRAYEREGDAQRQADIRREALCEAQSITARLRQCGSSAVWFTYHLYHKAPDWIGPAVCEALSLPYVVAEASVANKQAEGRWRLGHAGALAALRRAALVVHLNSQDIEGVATRLGPDGTTKHLPPFLDVDRFRPAADAGPRQRWASELRLDASRPWIVCVGMMRPGNKQRSFEVLTKALQMLTTLDWAVLVVGDGAARAAVQGAFAPLDEARVRWLGLRERGEVVSLLQACDLFAWPAVDEPMGMAMLEAQACGLPVVASRSRGVADIVSHGETGLLASTANATEFSGALEALLLNADLRARFGGAGRARALARHDAAAAAKSLNQWLSRLIEPASATVANG